MIRIQWIISTGIKNGSRWLADFLKHVLLLLLSLVSFVIHYNKIALFLCRVAFRFRRCPVVAANLFILASISITILCSGSWLHVCTSDFAVTCSDSSFKDASVLQFFFWFPMGTSNKWSKIIKNVNKDHDLWSFALMKNVKVNL